jgi:hypothetical protein
VALLLQQRPARRQAQSGEWRSEIHGTASEN